MATLTAALAAIPHTTAPPTTAALPHVLADGRLVFRAPPELYATLPCWYSADAWLGSE